MFGEGIVLGKYTNSVDTIIEDLKPFQSFFPRHFKNHLDYETMCPSFNQPERFFATAKTHRAASLQDNLWKFEIKTYN